MTTTVTKALDRHILTSLHGRELGLDANRGLVVLKQGKSFSFSAAAGAANTIALTIQACDNEGNSFAAAITFMAWLSDATTGIGITATANTSELTATTGALLAVLVTEKMWMLQTDITGKCVVVITDTGKNLTNFACLMPGHQNNIMAATFVAGNYG